MGMSLSNILNTPFLTIKQELDKYEEETSKKLNEKDEIIGDLKDHVERLKEELKIITYEFKTLTKKNHKMEKELKYLRLFLNQLANMFKNENKIKKLHIVGGEEEEIDDDEDEDEDEDDDKIENGDYKKERKNFKK